VAASDGGGGHDRLVTEALRLCDRYLAEVVLAFDLCPWAEPAIRGGRVRRRVLPGAAPAPDDALPFIDDLAAGDAEIGLLLLPRLAGGRAAFERFAEQVRRADGRRRAGGVPAPFLIAAFHPEGAGSFRGPHDLASFLRRTPDPMLQLVRAETLDRIKTARPETSDEVARRNHHAMDPGAAARLDAAVQAIRADRARSYAALTGSGTG
jgi:hypothetical protein